MVFQGSTRLLTAPNAYARLPDTAMADELDWLEMLVASERIQDWLQVVCSRQASLPSRRQAMRQMADAATDREAYAEEARRAGAVAKLTKVLATTDDLVLKQAMVKFCTHLELASAFVRKSRSIQYGDLVIHIKEGALGDGLGARVWVVAHTLCRELLERPDLVKGKRVLEIGSGCGLCGIVAAKLGASPVVLTDHEEKVLLNLRDCVAANSQTPSATSNNPNDISENGVNSSVPNSANGSCQEAASAHVPKSDNDSYREATAAPGNSHASIPNLANGSCQDAAAASGNTHASASAATDGAEPELFDPDNAESCDDLDEFFRGNGDASQPQCSQDSNLWEHDNMQVRYLDWSEALACEQRHADLPSQAPTANQASDKVDLPGDQSAARRPAPHIPPDQTYDVIIGTDILYEEAHAPLVAAVLKQRLAADGQALICCAVRDQGIFDQFKKELSSRSIRSKSVPVQPRADDHGIAGKQHDYEGGFVLIAMQHLTSSATWYGAGMGYKQVDEHHQTK